MAKVTSHAKEMGIITDEEIALLAKSANYSSQVIQVDEFGPYELGPKNAHPEWAKRA